MAGITQLDTGIDQSNAKKRAGDTFTDTSEKLMSAVDTAEEATLGLMMKTGTDMMNAETKKQVDETGPGALSKDTKKASGQLNGG